MTDTDTTTVVEVPDTAADSSDPVSAKDAAPWGYKDDGTPYKRDPAIYAKRSAGKSKKSSGRKRSGPDFTNDVRGMLQLVELPLAAAGGVQPAFLADAVALNMHADGIATAVNDLALNDPRVAAVLERLGKVGPYGALIASVSPLIVQVAANHKLVQPGIGGTVAPEALIDAVAKQAAAEREDQAATPYG